MLSLTKTQSPNQALTAIGEDPAPIRIVLADDNAPVRGGLASILRSHGYQVVGQAGDGAGAVRLAEEVRPDLVLLDVRMPGMDGLQALAQIRRRVPESRVLMLSTYEDSSYILRALTSGAAGYLLKGLRPQDLIGTIDRTVRSQSALQQQLMTNLQAAGEGASTAEVVDAHFRAFGELAKVLLDPGAGSHQGRYASMVEAVTAYGLAVSQLLVMQQTERQRLEREIEARTEEIRAVQRELAAAEHKAALLRLTTSAAHGIRTPLAVISNAVSLIRMQLPERELPRAGKYFDLIGRQVDEADQLLEQLLRYASLEVPRPREHRLSELVASVVASLPGEVAVGTVALEADPWVLADGEMSREALGLLLPTAAAVANGDGPVGLRIGQDDGRGTLRVEPPGLQVRLEPGQSVFEPLLRTGTRVVNFELVLSRSLFEAQGADLSLVHGQGQADALVASWPLAGGPDGQG